MENNKKTILVVIIGAIIVVLVVALLLRVFATSSEEKNGDQYVNDFPVSSDGEAVQAPPGSQPVTVQDVFGNSVSTTNFKVLETTVSDPVNEGVYVLAGDPGFCLPDGSCPGAYDSNQFLISYSEQDSFFSVLLLEEPIATARDAATQFLYDRLGVSQEVLCTLNVSVTVPQWVNEFYAGEELRLSGCPDSIPLE